MARRRSTARRRPIRPTENDRISSFFRDMVPDELEGTDRFLDIVTWNIKFFNLQDSGRVAAISRIMAEINADVFVLQEIEDRSMDTVAENLRNVGAGFYKTFYGTNGGDQRVALMYDTQFVRASENPEELFTDDPTVDGSNKKVFPRRPVHVKLTVDVREVDGTPFDFQLVGVHLKSQRRDRSGDDGTEQRREAANRLANWMTDETTDEDVIITGDWNAIGSKPEFKVMRDLEAAGKAEFQSFNPGNEGSHFFANGRSSRLDYIVLSAAAKAAAKSGTSQVITWNRFLEDHQNLRRIIDDISDHMPVVARFYFVDED